MTKYLLKLLLIIFLTGSSLFAQEISLEKTKTLVDEIAAKSYPEIKLDKIKIKTFESDSNYFKARFSYTRFLTFQKMRHIIYVNPEVYKKDIPSEAIRGILAHELAHVLYYTEKNRLELLGLAGLASKSFTTKFERKADLEAIARGYGKELIAYREWLYKNVPADKLDNKKRDYFTPEEIKILIIALNKNPKLIDKLKDNVPLNYNETKKVVS